MEGFEQRKASTMAALSSRSIDKSPKGTIDTPIIPLLTIINHHPSYFTTSSCSGRISIFSHLPNKPKGGSWLFISHEPTDPNSVLPLLFPPTSTESTQSESSLTHQLVFRFEPLIIAVECKDVGSAQNLVSLGIACGFRESGITSVSNKRVIVAIRCSVRMEVPLGSRKEMMVSPEYVRYLVEIANDKMGDNWRRTQGFMEGLKKNGFVYVENGSACDKVEEDNCADASLEMANLGTNSGPLGSFSSSLAMTPIRIVGERVERLFIWGHSSCTISNGDQRKILVYGGFGGVGRHARRNDCLLFDPSFGEVTTLSIKGSPPCPRVGHTSSLVGVSMFVIGGRADPANILDDTWIFDIPTSEWKSVTCSGDIFSPRHRHAAAVAGSKIYVFGGINKDTLYSSLLVLDVESLQWKEVVASGEWPCARHSHSLVAHGSKLYLFGGYDGERALGDLYSFDVCKCHWSKFDASGKAPYARFSHSMFVYKDYLGVIGGCPVKQHILELSFLDLQNLSWKHVTLDSIGKELFVRSTANIVNGDLILTGGGAACYAFGTKFSEPIRINLLHVTLGNSSMSSQVAEEKVMSRHENSAEEENTAENGMESLGLDPSINVNGNAAISKDNGHVKETYWVAKLQKNNAKPVKDILKKFGWLDVARKVYSHADGLYISFPVTEKFCSVFSDMLSQTNDTCEELNDLNLSKVSINSYSMALRLLVSCGVTVHVDEFVAMKKGSLSPLEAMRADVALLLKRRGLSESLLEQLPKRWERLGDIVVLPITCFNDPAWDDIGGELWSSVAKALGARRLARQGHVAPNGTRDSRLEILVGDNGWVEHRENGILYCFDATKCMFSWGNLSEKLRMARLDCKGEVIVDLFAGIGYFTLPFLVRAHAKFVYSCEWNPFALEALQHNLEANFVTDHCIVLEGDNRLTAPKEVADRVCLGLLPSSEDSWVTAVRALRKEGGTLHIHGNVKDSEETIWTQHVIKSISEIAKSEGRCWNVSMVHLERVKWYAPHVRHVVADIKCEQFTEDARH